MVKVHGSLTCLPVIYGILFCSKLHERTVTSLMTIMMVMAVTDDYSSCKDSDDVLQYTS